MNDDYTIFVDSEPLKYTQRLDRKTRQRISDEWDRLAADPYHQGTIMMKGRHGLRRSRVGDYRLLYVVDEDLREITIITIGPRGDVYKG